MTTNAEKAAPLIEKRRLRVIQLKGEVEHLARLIERVARTVTIDNQRKKIETSQAEISKLSTAIIDLQDPVLTEQACQFMDEVDRNVQEAFAGATEHIQQREAMGQPSQDSENGSLSKKSRSRKSKALSRASKMEQIDRQLELERLDSENKAEEAKALVIQKQAEEDLARYERQRMRDQKKLELKADLKKQQLDQESADEDDSVSALGLEESSQLLTSNWVNSMPRQLPVPETSVSLSTSLHPQLPPPAPQPLYGEFMTSTNLPFHNLSLSGPYDNFAGLVSLPPVTTSISPQIMSMQSSFGPAQQVSGPGTTNVVSTARHLRPTAQVFAPPVASTQPAVTYRSVPTTSVGQVLAPPPTGAGHPTALPGPGVERTFEKSLPKWNLEVFSGDPLQWPEWRGMFVTSVMNARITDGEKMLHLKTLLSGTAKNAIAGFSYDGSMLRAAWSPLERKFGQPDIIVGAQLEKLNSFTPVRMHSSEQLLEFSSLVSSIVNVLTSLGFVGDLCSSGFLQTAVGKLPPNLKEQWFRKIPSIEKKNLLGFHEWLLDIADAHQRLLWSNKQSSSSKPGKPEKTKTTSTFVAGGEAHKNVSKGVCSFCQEQHPLWRCKQFASKTPTERAQHAKKTDLCFSCLAPGHVSRGCTKNMKCREKGCKRSHNTLLHGADRVHGPENSASGPSEDDGFKSASTLNATVFQKKGLLQVIQVTVSTPDASTTTYALCDSGSDQSWVSAALRDKLAVMGTPQKILLSTFGGVTDLDSEEVTLSVNTVHMKKPVDINVLVKDDFSVGSQKIDLVTMKKQYPHLKPLPNDVICMDQVNILLGQDSFQLICPLEYRSAGDNKPWAVRLSLGWVASGPLPQLQRENLKHCSGNFAECADEDLLASQIRTWWENESYESRCSVDARSREDKLAIRKLETQTWHNGERYVVPMLWSEPRNPLPNNYVVAKNSFLALEKRLSKDPHLKQLYADSIRADVDKDYMRRVTEDELHKTKDVVQYYLPHHGVVNPHKPNKVRRVCNAASKFAGSSLNDHLLIGPDLLSNLYGILMRFRQEPVAVTSDIEGMFLQIAVPEEDQPTLRIIWREDPEDQLQVFQYTRHVFGKRDSPTVANYAVRRTADDNRQEFPKAAALVHRSLYVDDFPKSFADVSEATEMCFAVFELLQRGGFKLTKWCSNRPEVMQALAQQGHVLAFDPQKEEPVHVLGIKWLVHDDNLVVSRGTDRQLSNQVTQREVLSLVSSVFDPLGLVALFVLKARLILKTLWQSIGQNWDSPLEKDLVTSVIEWYEQLSEIQDLQIPRLYFSLPVKVYELHVFSDASLSAMSSVLYLRGLHEDGTSSVAFLMGKSRVAPLKAQTVPKLELQAAVVGSRLADVVKTELDVVLAKTVFWSDSTTALIWIASSHRKLPVYVANRVAEILQTTSVDQWKFVPGELNPADCGTRGLDVRSIKTSAWLTGPAFLLGPEDDWPKLPGSFITATAQTCGPDQVFSGPVFNWKRFSSFLSIQRTLAYCLRFLKVTSNLKATTKFVQADEFLLAKQKIWLLIQKECFADEYKALSTDRPIVNSSRLAPLVPFFDPESGLLRATGRLRKSPSISFRVEHPIILTASHPAVQLYLLQVHNDHFHQGVEFLRSIIQQELWVLKLRSALRKIKMACVHCSRRDASTLQPPMADLPVERISDQLFPFAHVGLDYFGPLLVKFGRKVNKHWVALFCCLTTRAVHLELCDSLDTDTCILAITRFMSRRGRPRTIVSDNGTNFIGAIKGFHECLVNWNSTVLETRLAQMEITWKLNPPSSPHFGGAWERLVRSCKRALYDVLGKTSLDHKTLSTVLCLVEQTLNSRPLTAASSDVDDLEAITPNHFLLGRPSICLPAYCTQESDITVRKAYKRAEAYMDQIWKRWMTEHVPTLNVRSKWYRPLAQQIQVGDLVWILEPTQTRSDYPMGRILEVFPSSDGNIRSVRVKTRHGVYRRPVVKLVRVPLDAVPWTRPTLPPSEEAACVPEPSGTGPAMLGTGTQNSEIEKRN